MNNIIKTLTFVNNFTKEELNAIGKNRQILGITHKGKFVLGSTYINRYTGNIGLKNMDYAVKYAILD